MGCGASTSGKIDSSLANYYVERARPDKEKNEFSGESKHNGNTTSICYLFILDLARKIFMQLVTLFLF